MILITLDKRPVHCRVELDGHDISTRLCRIEVDADVGRTSTLVRLTLVDDVTIAGVAGTIEFIGPPKADT